ncbi:MAG: hypothetical protein ACQEWE_13540 [Bacillota bacterium]
MGIVRKRWWILGLGGGVVDIPGWAFGGGICAVFEIFCSVSDLRAIL